jgi:threonine aldolase
MIYRQDPTVIALETRTAAYSVWKQVCFPSGIMANQTAIKVNTQPGEQLIADKYAHVYHYEGGGVSFNSGVSCCLLDGKRGMINAQQVAGAINDPEFYNSPLTSLVCVENTTNKGGGACYELKIYKDEVCVANNLKFHMDGARIWNALVAKKQDPKLYGPIFDTISVCFSKGLGAPVGSVLLANKATIARALRVRKILGGGMRQVGYLAAAGIYALDHNISALKKITEEQKSLLACLVRQVGLRSNLLKLIS